MKKLHGSYYPDHNIVCSNCNKEFENSELIYIELDYDELGIKRHGSYSCLKCFNNLFFEIDDRVD